MGMLLKRHRKQEPKKVSGSDDNDTKQSKNDSKPKRQKRSTDK